MNSIATNRSLRHGEKLNGYRVERILADDESGVIYLAFDTSLDLRVVVREYVPGVMAERNEPESLVPASQSVDGGAYQRDLDRIVESARNRVLCRHPNIVRVMSVFEKNNKAYVVMAFEEGEEFRRFVEREGPCSEVRLQEAVFPILDGLAEMHRHGCIHGAIKPANILLRHDGSPVLLGFSVTLRASVSEEDELKSLASAATGRWSNMPTKMVSSRGLGLTSTHLAESCTSPFPVSIRCVAFIVVQRFSGANGIR